LVYYISRKVTKNEGGGKIKKLVGWGGFVVSVDYWDSVAEEGEEG